MGLVSRGAYRTRQFWQALRAGPLTAAARREVAAVLRPAEFTLFETQSYAGQQHSYQVMRTLLETGHDERDLLVAALLHDVGKARLRLTWLDRIKVVLTHLLAPGLARKWAYGRQNRWTRAYLVRFHHPAWSASALAEAGGSPLSVALVRRHQDPLLASEGDSEENRLLALLQWADDQN